MGGVAVVSAAIFIHLAALAVLAFGFFLGWAWRDGTAQRQKPSTAELQAIRDAINYLETANSILEDEGNDEDDIADASDVVWRARAALRRLQGVQP